MADNVLQSAPPRELLRLAWRISPASMAVRLSQGRWRIAPHLEYLGRRLVDLAMGRCPRLIITLPPRHGKSELVSHWFPVWLADTFRTVRIILCSYEFEFASRWGGKARDTILANQEELGVRLKGKLPAAHHWETAEGGAMMCAGVGGPITGKGADVLIIDDFVKNREDAESFTMREKIWDWWTSTARTRLEPNAGVVVMATRWHKEDLIGKLLAPRDLFAKGSRENWEVVNFPALAIGPNPDEPCDVLNRVPGQSLWPERYDEKDLSLIRGAIGERDWVALFQQRPASEAEDGDVYFAFDERQNIRDREYDPRYPLCVSFDFNVDPMCFVLFQYERGVSGNANRIWILDEAKLNKSNTYEACAELSKRKLALCGNTQVQLEVYGDAAGSQKSANSRRTNYEIIRDFLSLEQNLHFVFRRRRANPPISDRVNAVNTMLRSASGDVRMTVHSKCFNLISDFKRVHWAVDADGNSKTSLDKSDKDLTHLSDALGYAVEFLFGLRGRGSGGLRGVMQ